MNYLREQGYWIPRGRVPFKNEIGNCISYRKYNALALHYPRFRDIPKHHMNLVKPFQHVGLDCSGHFCVKVDLSDMSVKMFVLIFTHLNIRAIHFELLPDVSSRIFFFFSFSKIL